uniref:Ion_trans_2 domain-containing protein n=1 Tax=Panagrellus redivivus TaxID=6233 RepID=A0A7E4VLI2_PANRE
MPASLIPKTADNRSLLTPDAHKSGLWFHGFEEQAFLWSVGMDVAHVLAAFDAYSACQCDRAVALLISTVISALIFHPECEFGFDSLDVASYLAACQAFMVVTITGYHDTYNRINSAKSTSTAGWDGFAFTWRAFLRFPMT